MAFDVPRVDLLGRGCSGARFTWAAASGLLVVSFVTAFSLPLTVGRGGVGSDSSDSDHPSIEDSSDWDKYEGSSVNSFSSPSSSSISDSSSSSSIATGDAGFGLRVDCLESCGLPFLPSGEGVGLRASDDRACASELLLS